MLGDLYTTRGTSPEMFFNNRSFKSLCKRIIAESGKISYYTVWHR